MTLGHEPIHGWRGCRVVHCESLAPAATLWSNGFAFDARIFEEACKEIDLLFCFLTVFRAGERTEVWESNFDGLETVVCSNLP